MNLKFLQNQGFSLIEVMVSVGLLSVVGLGMVALNSQHKNAQTGIKSAGDMSKVMSDLRTIIGDPKACENNFIGKVVSGGTLSALKDSKNNQILKVGDTFANNTYELTDISVEEHDTYAERTRILFKFKSLTNSVRSKTLAKSFNVFSKVESGKISECLDPVKLTAEGAVKKMCLDVDPLKEGDCEKNYDHLLAEVKELYCKNHPYLEYDSVTKKCKPLDAGKTCTGGKVMNGYSSTGKTLSCIDTPNPTYPTPDTNAVPNATPKKPCSSWSSWAPSDSTVCFGNPLVQTHTCLDSGSSETETQSAVGSKTDGSCCSDWSPAADQTCSTEKLTQTNSCGQTRSVDGTKSCSKGCTWRHPVGWDNGRYPIVQCAEWFNPVSNPVFTEEVIKEGATRYMNAGWCPQGGSCNGSLVVRCVNGKVEEVSRTCNKGAAP